MSLRFKLFKSTYILLLVVSIASFMLGRLLASGTSESNVLANKSTALRAGGFKFVSPLLLGDYGNNASSSSLKNLEELIASDVQSLQDNNSVDAISVYYRNLSTSEQLNVNADEKYFPASLSKVPLAMAYYKLDDSQAGLLSTRGQLQFTNDYNFDQEIKPDISPISGNEYSIQELIDMMIKYSDNAGFELLLARPGTEKIMKEMFDDLQLFYPYNQKEVFEVFTVSQYAQFFRLLYNSTYLSEQKSEALLGLLTQSTFKDGIVAGVANNVAVAHKYSLSTHRDMENGGLIQRQLHDCGIVYYPNKPYLLCIMTKSSAPELKVVEQALQQISATVYDYIDSYK